MMNRTIHPLVALALAGVATLSLGAGDARAHATLEQGSSPANAMYKAVIRVPHGCDGAATHTLTVSLPDGVVAAKPMPKAGWDLAIETGAYDKTYDYYGRPMADGVRKIVWSGGELLDAHYDEFVFRARITEFPAGHRLAFPVVQDCTTGQVAWTEIAAPDQDPHDLAHPAPSLTILATDSSGHGHGHGAHGATQDTAADSGVTITGAFARASAGPVKTGAAYLTITNWTETGDRLIGARTGVSEKAEIHTHLMDNGIMRMRQVEAVEIPAGGVAELKPGGDHVMLMGLKAPLQEGESFPLTLIFETAGEVEVTVGIAGVGAQDPAGDHSDHDHSGHKKH